MKALVEEATFGLKAPARGATRLLRRSSDDAQGEPTTVADAGDTLPQPGMRAVIVVRILPYLRKLVARQLDGRLHHAKAGHFRQDLRPAGRQRGHVVGL